MLLTLTCRNYTRPLTSIQTVPSSVTNQFESNITCVSHCVREGEGGGCPGTISRYARVSTANQYLRIRRKLIPLRTLNMNIIYLWAILR